MSVPKDYRFTESHEWLKTEEENVVTIGITEWAVEKLGDIVSVDLPRVGDEVEKGEAIGLVDSQKASSEVFAPVSGVVIEVNEILNDDLNVLMSDPYEEGWLVRIEVEDQEQIDELMTADDYEELLGRLEDEEA
ncbi:glycine cleavage system protein GcvH [Myxococcota bacterium]|nr:glycine cleavage system protein GcvH [Myxococcota bacterium]